MRQYFLKTEDGKEILLMISFVIIGSNPKEKRFIIFEDITSLDPDEGEVRTVTNYSSICYSTRKFKIWFLEQSDGRSERCEFITKKEG